MHFDRPRARVEQLVFGTRDARIPLCQIPPLTA